MKGSSLRLGLAGLSMIAVSFGFARYGYGLFVPVFREEFAMSTAALGLVSSAAYAAYLIALLLAGFLSARVSPRAPAVLGGASAVVGMVLVALSPTTTVLAAGVLLASTSSGLTWAPFTDAVAQAVRPETRNRTLSIISTGTTFGLMTAGPVSLLAEANWRGAWLVFAVLALASTVWNARLLPGKAYHGYAGSPESGPGEGNGDRSGAQRTWLAWQWLLGARPLPLFYAAFAYGLAGAFYWTYAADLALQSGLPSAARSILWTAVGLAGIAGLATGDFVGRFGLRPVLAVTLLVLAAATVVLGAAPGSWATVVLSGVLYGPGFMTMAALLSLWSSSVFTDRPSTGFSATLLLLALGSIAGPATLGLLAEAIGLRAAFLVTAGFILLGVLVRPRTETG